MEVIRKRLLAAECVPLPIMATEFARLIATEFDSMAHIVRDAQIKLT